MLRCVQAFLGSAGVSNITTIAESLRIATVHAKVSSAMMMNGWHRQANARVFDIDVELQHVSTASQRALASPFSDAAGSSTEHVTPVGHRYLEPPEDGNAAPSLRPPVFQATATPGAAASRWRVSAQKIAQMNKSTSRFANVSQSIGPKTASPRFLTQACSDIASSPTWGRAGGRPKTPLSQ